MDSRTCCTPISDDEIRAVLQRNELYWRSGGIEGERGTLEGYDLRERFGARALFRGANLAGVSLERSNLANSDFRDADLRGASLKDTVGLAADSLGGADLTGATLPAEVGKFTGLAGVADVSRYLQSLFKIILAIVSFSILTVLSVRDENLIERHALPSTPLPVIQASISMPMFAWVMPLVIFFLYLYLLIYLYELWARLADLPARFPDGISLDKRAYPLTTNAVIRVCFQRLKDEARDRVQSTVSALIVHGPVILGLFIFWLCFLRIHDHLLSTLHASLLLLSCCAATFYSVTLAPHLLEHRGPPEQRSFDSSHPRSPWPILQFMYDNLALGRKEAVAYAILFAIVLLAGSWAIERSDWHGLNLDIENKLISPPVGTAESVDPAIGVTHGADLEGARLQRVEAYGVVLAGANLKHANLSGAFLVRADLRSAILYQACLENADLAAADLRGADLRGAGLSCAFLSSANDPTLPIHNGPNLMLAHLEGAVFNRETSGVPLNRNIKAKLAAAGSSLAQHVRQSLGVQNLKQARNYPFAFYDGPTVLALELCPALVGQASPDRIHASNLTQQTLRGYNFQGADLSGTAFHSYDFEGARFDGADLARSSLENCNLTNASFAGALLQDAVFRGARLRGAVFRGAQLRGADFQEAQLEGADFGGADLTGALHLSREQILKTKTDSGTQAP